MGTVCGKQKKPYFVVKPKLQVLINNGPKKPIPDKIRKSTQLARRSTLFAIEEEDSTAEFTCNHFT